MTAASLPLARPSAFSVFLDLTKFKISVASTFTAAMGYIAYRRGVDLAMVSTLIGTLLLAMASSVLNEIQERKLDALMERTCRRPLPSGIVSPAAAMILVLLLALSGFTILRLFHGWMPTALGLLAMVWYNGFYTPLKRRSAFAVVPGSVIGALPPAIGWTAAGGSLGDPALAVLCFVFFVWQVPHFWLLSLLHAEGYEQAGFPTLTRLFSVPQILRLTFTWTCGTVAIGALLPIFGATRGWAAMGLLAAASIWLVFRFRALLQPESPPATIRKAFMQINVYALTIMVAVVVDALGMK